MAMRVTLVESARSLPYVHHNFLHYFVSLTTYFANYVYTCIYTQQRQRERRERRKRREGKAEKRGWGYRIAEITQARGGAENVEEKEKKRELESASRSSTT